MKLDKKWILWSAYFAVEFGLLWFSVRRREIVYGTTEQWCREGMRTALSVATASTSALALSLATWRMRWSMRPKVLRILMLGLLFIGLFVSGFEWQRYLFYSHELRKL